MVMAFLKLRCTTRILKKSVSGEKGKQNCNGFCAKLLTFLRKISISWAKATLISDRGISLLAYPWLSPQ